MNNYKNVFNKIVSKQEIEAPGLEEKGAILFQVTTGDGSIPVKNARITLRRKLYNDIYFVRILYTNADGKTITIIVDAPPKDLSLSPEFSKPYYVYISDIEADGYHSVEDKPIQVFEGVTTIQTVILDPLGISRN